MHGATFRGCALCASSCARDGRKLPSECPACARPSDVRSIRLRDRRHKRVPTFGTVWSRRPAVAARAMEPDLEPLVLDPFLELRLLDVPLPQLLLVFRFIRPATVPLC